MFSKLRKILATGLLGVVLAYTPACKDEIKIVKLPSAQEGSTAVQESSLEQKVAKVQPVIHPPQEEPKSDVPPIVSVERRGADGKIIKKEKCYLKEFGFQFCGDIEKNTYLCIGKGPNFNVGGDIHYLFFLDNGSRSTSNIQAEYKVTRGKKIYFSTRKKNLTQIDYGGVKGFQGEFSMSFKWPAAKYGLTITLREPKSGCTHQFKKIFELFEEKYEGGWEPRPSD